MLLVQRELKLLCLLAFLLFLSWLSFSYEALYSAIKIWYGNEIFNHGFFILPGIVYFVYLKRGIWLARPISQSWLALPLIALLVLVYIFGVVGDIQVFMHASAFGLLPLLCWMLVGSRASLALLFPFSFIFFAIPLGQELIPTLQQVTADLAVVLLKFTGIPLFRSGLYIEIPQGRFLVAEACSGISFFIASMVVGSVYSYLNFTSLKKRIVFFGLSVFYPIIANAIRVFGIILVGYWSDMEHAVGADHLIYGWFFFAFVLISLLAIGEWMRDKQAQWSFPIEHLSTANIRFSWLPIICSFTILIAGGLWVNYIENTSEKIIEPNFWLDKAPVGFNEIPDPTSLDYVPALNKVSEERFFIGSMKNQVFDIIYQAWFDGSDGELVSGLHRLYKEKEWSLVEQRNATINTGLSLNVNIVSNPVGDKRLITSWYIINNRLFANDTHTKLYQTKRAFFGGSKAGLRLVVSVAVDSNDKNFNNATKRMIQLINQLSIEGIIGE